MRSRTQLNPYQHQKPIARGNAANGQITASVVGGTID
jgi:hypothetical protein